MSEQKIPSIRQRINISQTAKGLHQVEVTLERVSEAGVHPDQMAEEALHLLKSEEKKLREDGRKLVVDETA